MAQKVQAFLQWRIGQKAAQVSALEEKWVLTQATDGNGTGHLLMQQQGDRLVAKLAVAIEGSRCFQARLWGAGLWCGRTRMLT